MAWIDMACHGLACHGLTWHTMIIAAYVLKSIGHVSCHDFLDIFDLINGSLTWHDVFHVSCHAMALDHEEGDTTADRDEGESCNGSNDTMEIPMAEKSVIAFPHEHHWSLQQEWMAVFGGASQITVIDLTPGSGSKLLGVLLSNGRGIGARRSQAHVKWVMENLVTWVKQKRLVTIIPLIHTQPKTEKPAEVPTPSQQPKPTGLKFGKVA